jgi:hypothetical protein
MSKVAKKLLPDVYLCVRTVQFTLKEIIIILKINNPLMRDQENRVAYLHSTVFGQKCLHCQCAIGKGITVQEKPAALCSKSWPHPGNALQQSSENLNIERIVDPLPFWHKFFMN